MKKRFYQLMKYFPSWVRKKFFTKKLYSEVKFIGKHVVAEGDYFFSDPRSVMMGSNVTLGSGVKIESEGGVILADGNRINKNFNHVSGICINTSLSFDRIQGVQINGLVKNRTLNVETSLVTAEKLKSKIIFVVSTGRSGTNTIASLMDMHPSCIGMHEPFYFLNRISTEWAHQSIAKDEVYHMLNVLFKECSFFDPGKTYVLSDLKFSNLISFIAEILPEAKFIWLTRNATDFVSSAYPRGWFDEHEYQSFHSVIYSHDSIVNKDLFDTYRWDYSLFRINGGSIPGKCLEWSELGAFGRCCWYWNYWNRLIEEQLNLVNKNQWLRLDLGQLKFRINELQIFAGLESCDLHVEQKNKATYSNYTRDKWTEDQIEIFKKYCAELDFQLYGEH